MKPGEIINSTALNCVRAVSMIPVEDAAMDLEAANIGEPLQSRTSRTTNIVGLIIWIGMD